MSYCGIVLSTLASYTTVHYFASQIALFRGPSSKLISSSICITSLCQVSKNLQILPPGGEMRTNKTAGPGLLLFVWVLVICRQFHELKKRLSIEVSYHRVWCFHLKLLERFWPRICIAWSRFCPHFECGASCKLYSRSQPSGSRISRLQTRTETDVT